VPGSNLKFESKYLYHNIIYGRKTVQNHWECVLIMDEGSSRIIHRGGGAYLRCPVSISVHFSLRNEGSSEYIRVCEGRESLSPNFYAFIASSINSTEFVETSIFLLYSHSAHHCTFQLGTFSMSGINFSPLYTPSKILPLENFVS
jgi:hypothetical protein